MKIETYNIIIADTQFLITESLKTLIKNYSTYSLLETAHDSKELKKILANNQKGLNTLLITDYFYFDYESIESLKQIKTENQNLHFLILTNSINHYDLNELTHCGIKNIIYKTTDKDELFLSIESAFKGKQYYCQEVLDLLMNNFEKNTLIESSYLTSTEKEITQLIANGLTTKEIAKRKNVSFHTVMSHRKNIFRKLDINNVSELLMWAMRNGIIDSNIEYYI